MCINASKSWLNSNDIETDTRVIKVMHDVFVLITQILVSINIAIEENQEDLFQPWRARY